MLHPGRGIVDHKLQCLFLGHVALLRSGFADRVGEGILQDFLEPLDQLCFAPAVELFEILGRLEERLLYHVG
jgi:hypothetical protein